MGEPTGTTTPEVDRVEHDQALRRLHERQQREPLGAAIDEQGGAGHRAREVAGEEQDAVDHFLDGGSGVVVLSVGGGGDISIDGWGTAAAPRDVADFIRRFDRAEAVDGPMPGKVCNCSAVDGNTPPHCCTTACAHRCRLRARL